MVITLPIKTVSEANRREHWAKKAARVKAHRKAAWLLTPAHALPCIVRLTRIAPRALDEGDNLPASLKAVRDGIADRLGVDDRDDRVTWVYYQRRGRPGEYAVEVELEAR